LQSARWSSTNSRSCWKASRDSRGDSEAQEQRRDAASWIKAYLADTGGEALVKDVLAAGKAAGYVEQTLKNARSKVADTDQSGLAKTRCTPGFSAEVPPEIPEVPPMKM
jgi:hypothetical protein